MYSNLNNEENAYKKIIAIDLQITRSLFNAYEAGFLKHLNIHAGDDSIIQITSIANDKFLDEIFNGRYNKPKEANLCDAVGNLEVLVDLNSDINIMRINQQRISNKACYIAYTDFVTKYLKRMMSEIIDTYYGIDDSIKGKNIKRQTAYKLFM